METQPRPKTYDCLFLGYAISGVAARGCNYSCLDTCLCRHTGEACVAKEGMVEFAEKLDKQVADISPSPSKCTDEPWVVIQVRIEAGELEETFGGVLVETHTKDKPRNPFRRT